MVTKLEFLAQLDAGWNDLQAFLTGLTDTQLTGLTDAGGWTVKDHLIHLVVWEDSVDALLEKQRRSERLGVEYALWRTHDYDKMNAVIYGRYRDMPLADVFKMSAAVHQRLIHRIERLTDEELARPYCDFQSDTTYDEPVMGAVISATYAHYAEHRPWMEQIAHSG
jgi:hypothetical protein